MGDLFTIILVFCDVGGEAVKSISAEIVVAGDSSCGADGVDGAAGDC